MLSQRILEDNAPELTRKLVELALAGDAAAMKICADRINPAPKTVADVEPVKVAPLVDLETCRAEIDRVNAAVGDGLITATSGEAAIRRIEVSMKALAAIRENEVMERLARLEALLRGESGGSLDTDALRAGDL